MENQKKLYVVLLEWCEDGDADTEIMLVTSDLARAKRLLKKVRDDELAKNLTFRDPDDPTHPERPWVVMADTDGKFFHRGRHPDFCSVRVLELIDPVPIYPEQ